MKRLLRKIRYWLEKYSFTRVLSLILLLLIVSLVINQWETIDDSARHFLAKHQIYIKYIIPLSIVLGLYHAYTGNANDQSLYLFKYLGPILASPLTCLTYAIVINSSFALIYIVCYDPQTLLRYNTIDKITVTYTLILLLSWSIFGILRIIIDCVRIKPKEKIVQSISAATQINIHEPYELNYWATQFGVTDRTIIDAVNTVGPSVSAVKNFLQK